MPISAAALRVEVEAAGVAQTKAQLDSMGHSLGPGLSRQSSAAQSAMAGTSKSMAGAAGAATATGKAMDGTADSADRAGKKMGPGLHKQSLIGSAAMLGLKTSLAGVAVSAVATGVKTASGLEQADIAFTTMLGSAKKADTFLADLKDFAAKTPFEFPDLVTASQRLLAMGFAAKDVKPTLTAVGDAVAGLGGGAEQVNTVTTALGQMMAKGKIQSDELLQLTEAGIPALKILADTYGVTSAQMQEMVSDGKVLADKAIPALVQGLEKGTKSAAGFGGMMAKQSEAVSGLGSTLMDTFQMGMADVIQPLIPLIAGGLKGAIALLGPMFSGLATGVKVLIDWGGQVVTWVKNLIAGFGGAGPATGAFGGALGVVSTVVQTVAGALRAFVGWLGPAWNGLWSAVSGVVARVMPPIQAFIGSAVATIRQYIGGFVAWAKPVWNMLWTVWSTIAKAAWVVIKGVITVGMGAIKAVIGTGLAVLKGLWKVGWAIFGPVLKGVWNVISSVVRGAVTVIGGIIKTFLSLLTGNWKGAWEGVKQIARGAWTAVSGVVKAGVGVVVGIVKGLPRAVGSAAVGFAKALVGAGRDLIGGLISGIGQMGGALVSFIGGFIADHVVGPIKRFLHIGSPSKVMADEVGRWIPAGLAEGIKTNLRAVRGAAMSMAAAAVPQARDLAAPSVAVGRAVAGRAPTRPGAMGVGAGRPVNVTITAYNPVQEPTSVTVNRTLQRAAALGWT